LAGNPKTLQGKGATAHGQAIAIFGLPHVSGECSHQPGQPAPKTPHEQSQCRGGSVSPTPPQGPDFGFGNGIAARICGFLLTRKSPAFGSAQPCHKEGSRNHATRLRSNGGTKQRPPCLFILHNLPPPTPLPTGTQLSVLGESIPLMAFSLTAALSRLAGSSPPNPCSAPPALLLWQDRHGVQATP
jgi:hypothetical protein